MKLLNHDDVLNVGDWVILVYLDINKKFWNGNNQLLLKCTRIRKDGYELENRTRYYFISKDFNNSKQKITNLYYNYKEIYKLTEEEVTAYILNETE